MCNYYTNRAEKRNNGKKKYPVILNEDKTGNKIDYTTVKMNGEQKIKR